MKNTKRWNPIRKIGQLGILLLAGTAVWAVIPDNIRDDNPVRSALYGTEIFRDREAIVAHPPATAREKLLAMAQSTPDNAEVYLSLANTEVQLLDFTSAEAHLRQYIEKSQDKDAAYSELEAF